MKQSTKALLMVIFVLFAVAIIGLIIYNSSTKPDEIEASVGLAKLYENKIEKVNIQNDTIYLKYTDSSSKKDDYDVYFYGRAYVESIFVEYYTDLIEAGQEEALANGTVFDIESIKFSITYNNRNVTSVWDMLIPIGSILMIIVLGFILFRSMSGQNKQAMNFGRSKANNQAHTKVRFGDVAGAEEEKLELQEIVDFLKNGQKFAKVGARIPRGVLLVGPPGTGKTLFAKAVAGEANVPFFSISGSDFVELYVGVGASRVRDLFDQAKRNMPCIVFIDEIDAVGRQRGAGMGGGHDEREQTLNQLLVQMDGFETNDGVIVMAATNRADILDPALLRPGRFDRQIYVNVPDVRGREAIFKVHARNKPIAPEVDFQILSRITSGFSGADIENLLNEAAILCARDNRTQINMHDLYEGINKVVLGPQKKSRLVTEVDKRITAYHEVGHALVAKLLPSCGPVHEVSIIPRGHAAGYTMTRPDNDNNHVTKGHLYDELAMSMGGRAAEEIVIQDITTGAVGDIKSATQTARRMVMEWGMSSELGTVFYGSDREVFLGRDYQSTHNYSESVAAKIDSEVSKIVEIAHQTALKLLTEHKKEMDIMARLLLERETIYTEEVDLIMQGAALDEVRKALDERLDKKYNAKQAALTSNEEVKP